MSIGWIGTAKARHCGTWRRHSKVERCGGLEQPRTATAKLRLAPRQQGQAGMCNGKGQLRPAPRRHGIEPRRQSMDTPRNSKDMHRDGSGQQCGEWHGVGKHSYGNGEHDFWRDMRKARLVIHFGRHGGLKRLLCRLVERGNRMAITDELRHNIEGAEQLYGRECPRLRAIADRIDEEHRKEMDNSYRDGYQEGKRDGDDDWYEEHEAYLEEHGWYQALDADKEPIKFGDEVEWRRGCGDHELRHGIVTGIKTDDVGGELVHEILVNVDGFTVRLMPTILHHYKQPTVEDVLREMLDKWGEMPANMTNEAIVTEYAAKLRLAGE